MAGDGGRWEGDGREMEGDGALVRAAQDGAPVRDALEGGGGGLVRVLVRVQQ